MSRVLAIAVLALLALAAPAGAAERRCAEPGASWERVAPAEAGMDAERLQAALDYGTSQASFAVRVYRRGCLVGEDRGAAVNDGTRFQSWSMAKSMTALVAMRAMTLGLLSPDDPVGALLPEADAPHGAITVRHLLTMTGGLRWNGLRDYDIGMPDRIHDALSVDVVRPPGSYFEYSQSGPALVAEAVARATGEDFQAFAQRELFGPVGIEPGTWSWGRDRAGHTQGFFDLQMTVGDYARLGELMRRGGVWQGRRLLSRRTVRAALRPTKTNGCYGWMIWVNASRPCVSPRVTERPVDDARSFPTLPADMYYYAGLFGQLVAVFPSQELVVVRTGQEVPGAAGYQAELFGRVLAAITDQAIVPPPDAAEQPQVSREDVDRGFVQSLGEPDQILQPFALPPLPAAGPARARAALLGLQRRRATRRGRVVARVTCPARWPGRAPQACRGRATLAGAVRPRAYRVAPGASAAVRLRLTQRVRRSLARKGRRALVLSATNLDGAGGTSSAITVAVRRAPRG